MEKKDAEKLAHDIHSGNGVTPESLHEWSEDIRWARRARLRGEAISAAVINVLVGVVVTGLLTALWLGIISAL